MKLALLSTSTPTARRWTPACSTPAHGADHFALLGNLVGYGADPAYVVQQAMDLVAAGYTVHWRQPRRLCRAAPAGTDKGAHSIAAQGALWTHEQLSPSGAALCAASLAAQVGGVLLVHASAEAPENWRYVDNEIVAAECLEAATKHPGVKHVFCGHVHQQTLYYRGAGAGLMRFTPTAGVPVPVPPHRQWVGTVGSVGQPRDGDPRAMYALLDTDHWHLRFERVPYAVADAAAAILATRGACRQALPTAWRWADEAAGTRRRGRRLCGARLHPRRGMAHIYRVECASGAPDPGFPMAMKIPRMTAGDGARDIVGFEVELQILPALTGPHVPRFVAAGDLHRLPYITMEYLQGHALQHWLDASERPTKNSSPAWALPWPTRCTACTSRNACHLDLKPGNVLFTHENHAVLLDFGLSCHAHFPDLLAEEQRKAVGSPAWMAPEQVVGVRGDPRSDIFAIGVMLYELATGELPFGAPTTTGGLRQRLWMAPAPPRKRRPDLAPWLQEIILRCLEPEAARRYPRPPTWPWTWPTPPRCASTERGHRTQGTPFRTHFKRWLRAAGMHYQPSPLPSRQIEETPYRHGGRAPQRCDRRHAVLAARSGGALAGHPAGGAAGLRHGAVALGQQHQRQRPQRNRPAPPAPRPPAPMGAAAGPDRAPGELPRARIQRRGPRPGALRRGQPRQHDDPGRRHPRAANPALHRHRAHARGARRALHRHPRQAVAAVCAPGGCQLSTGSENWAGRAAACRQRGARHLSRRRLCFSVRA